MKLVECTHYLHLQVISVLLLTVFCIMPVQGQAQTQDPFLEVPASARSRLVERLKLLIEYDRDQQWEKMYDLLSERFTQGETKEHLISRRRYVAEKLGGDELVDFTPQSATSLTPDSGWWFIRGCGEFRTSGRSRRVDSVVEAYLQNGEWYFSQIRMNTPVDGDPKPCQQLSQNTKACSAHRKLMRPSSQGSRLN